MRACAPSMACVLIKIAFRDGNCSPVSVIAMKNLAFFRDFEIFEELIDRKLAILDQISLIIRSGVSKIRF
jgi:hypothetical protein